MPAFKLVGSAMRLAAGEAQRRLKESDKKKKKKSARQATGQLIALKKPKPKPKPPKSTTINPFKKIAEILGKPK